MEYNNIAKECIDIASSNHSNLVSSLDDLKGHWKGTAATKFFSVQEEIIGEMDYVSYQLSVLQAITNVAKQLEQILEEIEKLEKEKTNLTNSDSTILFRLGLLYNDKERLLKQIDVYLEEIINNKRTKDLDLSVSETNMINFPNTISTSSLSILPNTDNSITNIKTPFFSETFVEKDNSKNILSKTEIKDQKESDKKTNDVVTNQSNNSKITNEEKINNNEKISSNEKLKFQEGTITMKHGQPYRSGGIHNGMDFSLLVGSDVQSTTSGRVHRVDKIRNSNGDYISYGKLVVIVDDENNYHYYAHLNDFNCKVGDVVKRGDIIGKSGNTGNSTGPHLHYEVREDNNESKQVDPMKFLTF